MDDLFLFLAVFFRTLLLDVRERDCRRHNTVAVTLTTAEAFLSLICQDESNSLFDFSGLIYQ